jgi:hypothetical protein
MILSMVLNPLHKKSPALLQGFCGLVGIRTPNLLIRSEMLYPIELQNHCYWGGKDKNSFCMKNLLIKNIFKYLKNARIPMDSSILIL